MPSCEPKDIRSSVSREESNEETESFFTDIFQASAKSYPLSVRVTHSEINERDLEKYSPLLSRKSERMGFLLNSISFLSAEISSSISVSSFIRFFSLRAIICPAIIAEAPKSIAPAYFIKKFLTVDDFIYDSGYTSRF